VRQRIKDTPLKNGACTGLNTVTRNETVVYLPLSPQININMAIPNSVMLETARRFDSRKPYQQKRDSDLKKVQWKANMDVMERIRLLKQIDSKERVEKRLKRLRQEAFSYLNTSAEAVSALAVEDTNAFDEVVFERILGQKDLMNVNFLEKGSVVARTVGKIVLKNSLGGVAGYGTGFLISPSLLMTNNHVLRDVRDAAFSHVEFDNQLDLAGTLLKSTIYKLDPDTFFATSIQLDVTVVALGPTVNSQKVSPIVWNKLIESEGKVMIGEYMNIIQHPEGRPKEFSFRANQLTDVLPQFLHYETDTEPGSSGSPVFNDQWEVVALHHSGVPKKNAAGKILNRKGQLWTPAMGENQIEWIANEGVRISTISQYLKSLPLQGPQKKYRNNIFDLEGPMYQLCYLNDDQVNKINAVPAVSESGLSSKQEDGSILYTIPIRVKVQVGDVSEPRAQPTGDTSVAGPQIKRDEPATPRPSPRVSKIIQTELQEALAELERAKTITYYDAAADKKQRDKYYKGIKPNGTKSAVYRKLSELVTDTHTTEFPYRPAKHLYTWVDLQPNKMLRSIYSGKEFEPEEIIEEDFANEARLLELSESLTRESILTDQQIAEQLAAFEATLPYNCEHVVPQSWFGKQEPMRGDLHHLFTCESGCNSFRGNTPYFDFTDFEEKIREACGRREGNMFEPGNGKGEVARSTLYFLLRYPGEINETSAEYTKDRIDILLSWNDENEVTDHEKHRNVAIFMKQGNRNPFIDFPDWAGKVNFSEGLG
jgi:endonuclease G, mitochondrial